MESSQTVTTYSSWGSFLTLILGYLQSDIWEGMEGYGEKGNILRYKLGRSFLRNGFVMCDFHSLSYSCISWNCLLALLLWNLRTDILGPFEDYNAKGNILQSKWERSFLRNFVVTYEFISQSYSFSLKKLFAKTVLVKFPTWYLEAHRGLRWKGKYLPFNTGRIFLKNCSVFC